MSDRKFVADVAPVCIVCDCDHIPPFDEKAARGMTAAQVRARWPRYEGQCGKCGARFIPDRIAYASIRHYLAGDW